jgi:hypothetical protein
MIGIYTLSELYIFARDCLITTHKVKEQVNRKESSINTVAAKKISRRLPSPINRETLNQYTFDCARAPRDRRDQMRMNKKR